MRPTLAILFVFFFSYTARAQQGASPVQALNAGIDYANNTSDQVASVVKSIINYYPDMDLKQKDSWRSPRYVCPVQPEEYYFNKALTDSKALDPKTAAALNGQLKQLHAVADDIHAQCRALDTYHKLEDYKQDAFAKAREMVSQLQTLTAQYRRQQAQLEAELNKAWQKRPPGPPVYVRATTLMRKAMDQEQTFLNRWRYNLQENIPSTRIDSALAASIADTDALYTELKQTKLPLGYPASSMWSSFVEALGSILEMKRNGQDGYNYEARKSDRYSNDFYLDLIGYYNGTLVSNYNSFMDYATADHFAGLKAMKFVPAFDIRAQASVAPVTVVPFQDAPHMPLKLAAQSKPVPEPVYEALKRYVAYIDETWRQVRHLRDVIGNFSSSAAYYKGLTTFTKTSAMQFSNKDFKLPLSAYQQAIAGSKALLPAYAQTLNQQTGVLQDIMREFYALSALLEEEVRAKRYEQDQLAHIYTVLERHTALFRAWDERKEQLYTDVRAIFDSYPPANPSSSWYVSGKALRDLTDLDHTGLFAAKRFYGGDSTVTISVKEIRQAAREVISREYDNLKGIEKIGRSNGLCPYTPYEDLPEHSLSLGSTLEALKPARGKDLSGYQHPYHDMLYRYNEVVDCYNKFCSLARVPLLPTVHQPELFAVTYPRAQKPQQHTATVQQDTPPAVLPQQKRQQDTPPATVQRSPGQVVHDTVYIEKRDTVYLPAEGENLRSMEGYAINHMVLLLDVSGSMEAPEKLPLLKESVLGLITMMRPEDKVSIITFSGKPKTLLASTSFKDEAKIRKAVEALRPSGKTDGDAALKLAYDVADDNYLRGGNNRILLATDGEFPLEENTVGLIEKFSGQDIFLSIFNFGKSPHAAQKLSRLAATGRGNYAPITKQNIEQRLIREAKSKKKAQ